MSEISRLDSTHGTHLAALSTLLLRTESVASSKIERVEASLDDYARVARRKSRFERGLDGGGDHRSERNDRERRSRCPVQRPRASLSLWHRRLLLTESATSARSTPTAPATCAHWSSHSRTRQRLRPPNHALPLSVWLRYQLSGETWSDRSGVTARPTNYSCCCRRRRWFRPTTSRHLSMHLEAACSPQ